MHIAPLISVQVITSVSLRNQKSGFIYVFPVSAPHGISPRAAWTPSARRWDTTPVCLLSPEPRRKNLSVGYDLFCRVELVSCMSRALNSHPSVCEIG